ncbi:UNVERIFIED_CONTAM: hypothetical protein K2H54_010951 [Gekko kuhli]
MASSFGFGRGLGRPGRLDRKTIGVFLGRGSLECVGTFRILRGVVMNSSLCAARCRPRRANNFCCVASSRLDGDWAGGLCRPPPPGLKCIVGHAAMPDCWKQQKLRPRTEQSSSLSSEELWLVSYQSYQNVKLPSSFWSLCQLKGLVLQWRKAL